MQKNSFSSAHVSGTLMNMTFSWNSHMICSLLKGCRTLPHSTALYRTLLHSEQQFRPGIRGTWKGFRQLTHPKACFSVYVIYLRRITCHSLAACTSAACSLAACSLAARSPGCSSPGLLVPRAARPPGCSFLGCSIAVTAASSTTFPWGFIEVFFNTLNGKFSFAVNTLCWLDHHTEMHKLVFF